MDESYMSISSLDEDTYLSEALGCVSPSDTDTANQTSSSKSIDISHLLNQPLQDFPKAKLDFTETPRNSSQGSRQRKRKNFARRCLSTDLNADFSLTSEDDQLSFQEFRQSKEIKRTHDGIFSFKSQTILTSIENRCSPKKSQNKCDNPSIELTPEFDVQHRTKSTINQFISRVPLRSTNTNHQTGGVPLQKCYSENHATIMRALQISSTDPSLIGDFSRPYSLPLLINSKHQDLKSVSCHALADVIRGRYNNVIESFTIVDCRYPYEYAGGHIHTAINVYTQEHVLQKFITSRGTKEAEISSGKRHILVFHCEFSSERGPSLCRFLRNKDRVTNSKVYPSLYYPEVYLLEGGYKEFYTHYSSLCEPHAYKPMNAKEHEEELRKYRSLVKSLSFDSKFSTHKRNLRL